MTLRFTPLLGLAFAFIALASPACDDEDDCPSGHEGCLCTADFQCLEGLECLSEYCVAANASGAGSGGASPDPSQGEGGSANNVEACESFVDSLDCGLPPGALDCSAYAQVDCDVTDYLDCLRDNTACMNDTVDVSGWIECVSLVEDCT